MMNSGVQYSSYGQLFLEKDGSFVPSLFFLYITWGTSHVAWPHGNTLPTSQGGLGKQIGQVTRETRDEF